MRSARSLGSLLVHEGLVAPDRMAEAIERQATFRISLDTALLEMGLLDEAAMVRALSSFTGYPPADTNLLGLASDAAAAFPRDWAEQLGLAPCRVGPDEVLAVACRPLEPARLEELSARVGVPVRLHAAPEFRVREAFARVYGGALPDRHRRLVARFGAAPVVEGGGPRRREAGEAPAPPSPPSAPSLPTPTSRAVAALAAFLQGRPRREEVLEALQRFLESRFAHAQVFVVSRGVVSPAGARKPRLPLDEPSVLTNVAQSGIPYRGPVPKGNHGLFAALGRVQPFEVVLAPVVVGGRVICVLWGDQGPEPLGSAADELMQAVPFAEAALARLLAQRGTAPAER